MKCARLWCAIAVTGIVASHAAGYAAAREAGKYYEVDLGDVPRDGESITSTTGKLLTYQRDDGTTAIQLIATINHPDSLGFLLEREDVPKEYSALFGGFHTLRADHWRGAPAVPQEVIVDLTDDAGEPNGFSVQLLAADGAPLANTEVEYTAQATPGAPSTTGNVQTDSDGSIFIPQFSAAGTSFWSEANYNFAVVEPRTGMRLNVFPPEYRLTDKNRQTTVAVPLLKEPSAPQQNLHLYTAQFIRANGEPAAGLEVTVSPSNYPSSLKLPSNLKVKAGPAGEVALAIPAPTTPARQYAARVLSIRMDEDNDWGRSFLFLKPGEHEIIRQPRLVTVDVRNEDGTPMQFDHRADPSTYPGFDNVVGMLGSLDTKKPISRSLQFNDDVTSPLLMPVEIEEPGTYVITAGGRFFKPQSIDALTTYVPFVPDPKAFEVAGKVVDAAGAPVPGAFVLVGDSRELAINHPEIYRDSNAVVELWKSTKGDFEKLGFYMARTGEDGRFHVSGDYLSRVASVRVIKPNHAFSIGTGLTPLKTNMIDFKTQLERLEGTLELDAFVLEEPAEVTLRIDAPAKDSATSSADVTQLFGSPNRQFLQIADDGTTRILSKGWISMPISSTETWTVKVPAATTFTLSLGSPQINGRITTTVLEPLEAGEKRDLGVMQTTPDPPPVIGPR